jgi:hypothetical protein
MIRAVRIPSILALKTGPRDLRTRYPLSLGDYTQMPIGPTGPTGPTGPSGGPTGPTGAAGATGATGASGSGAISSFLDVVSTSSQITLPGGTGTAVLFDTINAIDGFTPPLTPNTDITFPSAGYYYLAFSIQFDPGAGQDEYSAWIEASTDGGITWSSVPYTNSVKHMKSGEPDIIADSFTLGPVASGDMVRVVATRFTPTTLYDIITANGPPYTITGAPRSPGMSISVFKIK